MTVHFTGGATQKQRILNDQGARNTPDRTPIPVRARIIWERDGEEWMNAHAVRRDDRDGTIFVYLKDPRSQTLGAWLAPDDVWWEGK